MNDFHYLTTETDGDNCLWITIFRPDTELNFIPAALLQEFKSALDSTTDNPAIHSILIRATATPDAVYEAIHKAPDSDKGQPPTPEEILETMLLAQQTLRRLTTLNIPSVVLLDGLDSLYSMALGMAASYCIASDRSDNTQGFIAAKLGIHLDITTTQNTVRRLGTSAAMDLLLTGDALPPQLAVEKGLIDACVPTNRLVKAAKTLLRKKPPVQQAGFTQHLSFLLPLRLLAGMNLTNKARQIGLPQNYPAPYALIRLWKKYGMSHTVVAQNAYAESIVALSQTIQAQNLAQVARLEQRLRYKNPTPGHNPVKHIHIIGSGMTVGDIATYLLRQGLNVSLQDRQPEAIKQTVALIKQNFVEQYAYRADQITTVMTNLTLNQHGKAMQQAELILVARGSHLADNQEIVAGLEENARPDAILATHSTTVPLGKIAAAMLNPQRLIGIHFCYPAFNMRLVEVSLTDKTDVKLMERTASVLRQLGKMPLVMKNGPGLLVDRILVQYIIQGIRLNQQGVPQTIIDSAGRDSGMPDGPLELADKLGLDYCLRVAEVLERAYAINIPYQLIDRVKTGKLGIKSGTGFYRYRNGNRLKPDRVEWAGNRQALQDKLTGQIREEASMYLEEGLIEEPALIDAGVIFGTGLAPYMGGPLYQQRHHNTRDKRA